MQLSWITNDFISHHHHLDECKDSEELASKCPVWKKQGECHKEESQKFMKKYCAKTCDKCDGKLKYLYFLDSFKLGTFLIW